MFKSIIREHHWTPEYCSNLYLDYEDYDGLIYWYNDVVEVDNSIKTKNTES